MPFSSCVVGDLSEKAVVEEFIALKKKWRAEEEVDHDCPHALRGFIVEQTPGFDKYGGSVSNAERAALRLLAESVASLSPEADAFADLNDEHFPDSSDTVCLMTALVTGCREGEHGTGWCFMSLGVSHDMPRPISHANLAPLPAHPRRSRCLGPSRC